MVRPAAQSGPVHVLQVTEASGGGVRRHLQRIIPELRRQNLAVDLLMGSGRAEPDLADDLAAYASQGCATALFGGSGTLAALAAGMPALRRAVRDRRPEVVHLHATRAGLLGRLALARPGDPPLVYSPHAFVFQSCAPTAVRWLGRWLERRLVRRTAAFVCVSAAEAETANTGLQPPPARVHVIENGLAADFARRLLPRDQARAAWSLAPDAVVVGFCGRLAAQKDLATLLRGLAGLREQPQSLRLVVCGDGPQEASLQRLAGTLGLGGVVRWQGFVPDAATRLRAFDLLALPSRYEGLSYTLLEALAAGVPVLAADLPANRLRGGAASGVSLVPAGEPTAWAEALQTALPSLPGLRARAAAAASEVLEAYSLERQAVALAALYAGLRRSPDPA